MNRTRPSEDVSFKLKVAVTSLISASNFLLFLSLVSNYWIYSLQTDGFTHWGVWNACNIQFCVAHGSAGYIKAALIVSFIFGLAFNGLAGVQIKYKDLYFQKIVGSGMISVGICELYGMAQGIITFGYYKGFFGWSWGYFVGWIAVILSLVAGSVSLYHHWKEPPLPSPVPEPTTTTTVETPPSAIIVS